MLQLTTPVLNMAVVSMYKPVIYKLKIVGGGKLDYYKSIGGTTKRGNQILKFQWGEAKGGNKIFDSNLVGGILEETMVMLYY